MHKTRRIFTIIIKLSAWKIMRFEKILIGKFEFPEFGNSEKASMFKYISVARTESCLYSDEIRMKFILIPPECFHAFAVRNI